MNHKKKKKRHILIDLFSFFFVFFAQRIQSQFKLSYDDLHVAGMNILKFYCFPGVTSIVMIDSTGQSVDIKIEYIPLHLIKL